MPAIAINEFVNLNSNRNAKSIANNQFSKLVNMEWVSGGAVFARKGIVKFKNNTQWGTNKVIAGTTFKRSQDSFYHVVVALDDGRLFYIRSNNANFAIETATWTEILSPSSATPALSTSATTIDFAALNNVLFMTDQTNRFYSWDGSASTISKVNDPVNATFTFTIADATAATLGAVYTDDEDTTRQFTVATTKITGSGVTTLTVYQSAGNTRPSVGGADNLSKVSGTGDNDIPYTAVSITRTFLTIENATNRLWVTDNDGNAHYSLTNVGTNFISSDAGFQAYDRVEGLDVSNFIAFSEGAVVVSEDAVTQRFQTSILTGYKPFDAAVSGSEVGQFKIQKLNSISGIVGQSAQEIGDSIIGLTPSGFITLQRALSGGGEFGLTSQDFISEPIKDIIQKINFSYANTIVSTVDYVNGRYLCAVPLGVSQEPSTVLVYDFQQSQPGFPKWSLFNYAVEGSSLSAMFSVLNVPFICDNSGNIYKTNVANTYSDDDNAYSVSLETKAFGGDSILIEKDFKEVWVNFLTPSSATQTISALKRLDGKLITTYVDGTPFSTIEVTPDSIEGKWDIIGNKWDSGLKWDSTSLTEQLINLKGINGRGSSLQILLSSSSVDLQWGVSSINIAYEDMTSAEGGDKT